MSPIACAMDVLGYRLSATSRNEFLAKERGNLERVPATDTYIKNGYMVAAPKNKEFPNLKGAGFMFDAGDKLCMVLLYLPKEQYGAMLESFKKKYRLIGEENALSGKREALFADGEDRIAFYLDAGGTTTFVMLMNDGFNRNNKNHIREHGQKPKFE